MMKWFTTIVFLFFVLINVQAQKRIPDAKLKTLKKEIVDIRSEIAKKDLTVISFWATWCAPCKKELNAIAEVYEDWQEDYNMQLIAVTIDDQRMLSKVPGIVSTNWWDYTVLADEDSSLRNALNITTIPRTLLVDNEGNVLYDHNGYKPGDELELEEKLKAAQR